MYKPHTRIICYNRLTRLNTRSLLIMEPVNTTHGSLRSSCPSLHLCLFVSIQASGEGKSVREADAPGFCVELGKDALIFLSRVFYSQMSREELIPQIKFQGDIGNCCVLAFTETWLHAAVPDIGITPVGFPTYCRDRTTDSG